MRRYLAGLVLACAAAVPHTAVAQTVEGEPTQAPGWTFTPAVIVGWMWDSNVALVTAVNENIQSDSMLVLTPSGSVSFLGKHTSLGAGYSGTIRRYREVGELNSFDQRLRVGFTHRPTARLEISARESFSRLPTTEDTELNGVPFRRIGSKVNSAGGGFEYRLTKLSTIKAQYELVDVSFDHVEGSPAFVIGGRSHGLSSDYSRRITERIALGAVYEIRFANVKTNVETDEPVRFQVAGASTRFALGPATSLMLTGGLSTLSAPRLTGTSIGPFIRAGITHHLQRATLDAGYERSFTPTFGFAASTQTEQIHGSVLMPVYQNRAYVQASTNWRRNDPLLSNEIALTSFFLTATAGYAVARPVRLEGFYTSAWQDTRSAGGRMNRHRLGVQVVLSSPVRVP
jgi:hypothetical protein